MERGWGEVKEISHKSLKNSIFLHKQLFHADILCT
jgi:hypothetical protein